MVLNPKHFVDIFSTQLILGEKHFAKFPFTPATNPEKEYQAANKKYVDDSFNGISEVLTLASVTTITVENGLITATT